MKKKLAIIFLLLVLISFVYFAAVKAEEANMSLNINASISVNNSNNDQENKTNKGIGQELSAMIKERKAEIRGGNYTGPQGQLLQVREMTRYLKQLRAGNHSVNTTLNITIEYDENNKTRLKVNKSDGKEIEIKIMPDTASERALERLRIKVCDATNNCTIQLKETGNDKNRTLVYELQAQRHVRILGLFKAKAQVRAEVNAENGQTTSKGPWWMFLSTKQD